jgi:hypothetical protein
MTPYNKRKMELIESGHQQVAAGRDHISRVKFENSRSMKVFDSFGRPHTTIVIVARNGAWTAWEHMGWADDPEAV